MDIFSVKFLDVERNIYVAVFKHSLCPQLPILFRVELLWLYQEGASYVYPDEWERFVEPIPKVERGDIMSAYHRRLTGDNQQVRMYIQPLPKVFFPVGIFYLPSNIASHSM